MLFAATQGFTLSLSMIMPIGSQNSMLLNHGIAKNHHLFMAALFMLYDVILISLGVMGGSLLLQSNQILFSLLTWGGVLFLFSYGAMSFKTALLSFNNSDSGLFMQKSLKLVFISSLMVTFLNPHAYIDTVMVIGSVGGQYSGIAKCFFLIGALSGSFIWFLSLAIGAAKLSTVLAKPKVKRIIDIIIGVIMWFIAWTLLEGWLRK